MPEPKIGRRTLLHGVGTLMALPALEAMAPLGALAQSAKKSPLRMAFMFVPNGIHMPAWTPATEGALDLMPSMQPLAKVRDSINVLTGLTQHNAEALGDGGGDHARSAAAWLTGCHPRKTDGAEIKAGISADQLAAQRVGDRTRFPSLELGCERGAQSGNCDSGYSCAYSSNIAWRGESTPVAHEVDPRAVFERLFGGADPAETAESRKRRETYRKSVLDFVMEDAKRLQPKLGVHDQDKLDEYLTGVREIERRVELAERANIAGRLAIADRPTGVPADFGEHIRLMCDMMLLAFQTDTTRIATFMLANDGSNRGYADIGVPEGHHDCSHHGGDPVKQGKVQQINTFHLKQVAYLLEKMQAVKEGDGTLLDNTMLVYGAGISDGDRHNHDDLPILLAGRGGGGIKTGRHIRYKNGTPMTNLFLCMLDRMGVHAETLGDSTGRLDQLI
ncbi:MAG TPA: DUF1552 domain-containing protein [Chthonomonadaceae bacterium]|nr:DUF1552 domain-containing protein [Chthonomonadaceae bacterium]